MTCYEWDKEPNLISIALSVNPIPQSQNDFFTKLIGWKTRRKSSRAIHYASPKTIFYASKSIKFVALHIVSLWYYMETSNSLNPIYNEVPITD